MARPKTEQADKRSKRVEIMLTGSEWEHLSEVAKILGVPVSEHVRKVIWPSDPLLQPQIVAPFANGGGPGALFADGHTLEKRVGWEILQALHEHLPDEKRPMSWSDLSDEQFVRICEAARRAIKTVNES